MQRIPKEARVKFQTEFSHVQRLHHKADAILDGALINRRCLANLVERRASMWTDLDNRIGYFFGRRSASADRPSERY